MNGHNCSAWKIHGVRANFISNSADCGVRRVIVLLTPASWENPAYDRDVRKAFVESDVSFPSLSICVNYVVSMVLHSLRFMSDARGRFSGARYMAERPLWIILTSSLVWTMRTWNTCSFLQRKFILPTIILVNYILLLISQWKSLIIKLIPKFPW
jgi:hypothetical protein